MKVISVKKAKPLATRIITTCNLYEEDCVEGGLINTEKKEATPKEYQKVLAIGDAVRNVKVGDMVIIDPTKYLKKRFAPNSMNDGVVQENPVIYIDYPLIEIDGQVCIMINEQDVELVALDYEEVEAETKPLE